MRLERSVDPPWIQCTTWCAALHFAGRSQPGQRQWPSRASSALRAGPDTVRFERPTSITVDSDPSRTRVTPLSHANRSTVLAEIGSAKSISAAGAPGRPSRVSTELVTWICGLCMEPSASSTRASASLRFRDRKREGHLRRRRAGQAEQSLDRARDLDLRPLHGTLRQLDQGIGQSAIPLAGVILAGFASQRLQRRAHGRPTHGVEDSVEHIGAVLPHAQVEAAVFDLLGLLGGITLGVGRVAEVTADVVELARRALSRLLQQPALLKAIRHCIHGAGHDGEMSETDLAALHSLDALGQPSQVLAHRQARGRAGAGHVTGVADPVDGAGRALLVVLVGAGELSRGLRELQLEAVDGLAEADELVAQQLSRHMNPTPYRHDDIIRTSVWTVNMIGLLIARSMKTRFAHSIRCQLTRTLSDCGPGPYSLFPVLRPSRDLRHRPAPSPLAGAFATPPGLETLPAGAREAARRSRA